MLIDFNDTELDFLEVVVKHNYGKYEKISVLVVVIINLLLLLIGSLVILFDVVALPLLILLFLYDKTSGKKLTFNLGENSFTRTIKLFGRKKRKTYNLDDMSYLECQWILLTENKFCFEFVMNGGERVKGFSVFDKNHASHYSDVLSSFLGIQCFYPVVGTGKYWREFLN